MSESIDLHFLGHSSIIGTAVLRGPDGVALIDPGPSTTVPALEAGLSAMGIGWPDVRWLLLTHIHLDHGGGAGTILAAHPHVEVYVHERGAPHMADPTKLVASATRLYKDQMDRLWGPVLPVPAARIRALPDHAEIALAGRTLEAQLTPGHASHHVCFFDPAERIVFAGDTAGTRQPGDAEVVPPTTPPEIDVDVWRRSTDRLLAWRPSAFFLTHFGLVHDPEAHIDRFWRRMDDWSARVHTSLSEPGTDDERAEAFSRAVLADLAARSTAETADAHAIAAPFTLCWQGLARYWRKRS